MTLGEVGAFFCLCARPPPAVPGPLRHLCAQRKEGARAEDVVLHLHGAMAWEGGLHLRLAMRRCRRNCAAITQAHAPWEGH